MPHPEVRGETISRRGATKAQRTLIVIGAALVAVVAMAASATTLADLGRAVGWGQILAWSLPVSVDVLALVAGLAWLAGGAGQNLGRALTLITVAVSVTLNAIGHLVATSHLTANSYLVIGVSAVPPLAAALAVHLGATVNADRTDTGPQTSETLGAVLKDRATANRGHHGLDTNRTADHGTSGSRPQATGDQDEQNPLQTSGPCTETATTAHQAELAPGTGGPQQQAAPVTEYTNQAVDPRQQRPESGPQPARTTDQDDSPPRVRTESADQDADQGQEVPWEVKVEVARKAALAEGRMTRRALRPHLRKHGITVSNESFGDLQSVLYADPKLNHLPRPPRRSR